MKHRHSTDTELWCGACKTMHPRSAFGKDKKSPNGIAYACKAIVTKRNRAMHTKNKTANNARHSKLRAARKASSEHITWALKRLLSDAKQRALSYSRHTTGRQ